MDKDPKKVAAGKLGASRRWDDGLPHQTHTKEWRSAYSKAHRAQFKAETPNWSEIERQRRAQRTPEQRERRRQKEAAWRAANPERVRAYNAEMTTSGYRREWLRKAIEADPQKFWRASRRTRLRAKYGISLETYDAMLAAQGGVCAICGRPETMVMKGKLAMLGVDHDHATGQVRGLLCGPCNMLIGGARHDPAVLESAIRYLEHHVLRPVVAARPTP